MSFESNTGLGVNNHYGPRDQKGTVGSQQTQDGRKIFTIDVERQAGLETDVFLEANTIIENVSLTQTAAVTTLTAGTEDISTATWATPVTLATGGELAFAGTGQGKVVITTYSVADSL